VAASIRWRPFPRSCERSSKATSQPTTRPPWADPRCTCGGRIHGTDVDLITAHFKSKLLTFLPNRFSPHDEGERARLGAYALYRQAAEAVTLRAAATDLLTSDHEAALMVLGDLNDEVEAATTQILNGPPGSEIATTGFDHPDTGDVQRLWNLAPRIPEAQRFSRKYRGTQ
jgi:hypothetical protein